MCEPFEKTSSMLDCGPHTPEGYVDLWAVKAYASRQDAKSCPASLVTGEPVVKVGEGMNKKKNKLKRKNFSSKACAGEGANKMSSGSNHQLLPSQPGTEWKTWAFLNTPLESVPEFGNCSSWRSASSWQGAPPPAMHFTDQ